MDWGICSETQWVPELKTHTPFLALKSQFQTGFWVSDRNAWVSERVGSDKSFELLLNHQAKTQSWRFPFELFEP